MTLRNRLPQIIHEEHPLRAFRKELDDMFDKWSGNFSLPEMAWPKMPFAPKLSVKETGSGMDIRLELPGVEEKDIDIALASDRIIISGEKKTENETTEEKDGRTVYHSECSYGSFQRVIPLPFETAPESVKAEFKHGVLKLHVPKSKTEQQKVKKIAIGEKAETAKKAA